MDFKARIFGINDEQSFTMTALDVFKYQYEFNPIYHQYVDAVFPDHKSISHYLQIPFLPIQFFKTHEVKCGNAKAEKIFLSSGTTGSERSCHPVTDLKVYRESLVRGFENVYGSLAGYDIFALMPSPSENPDSSLIFMVNEWIRKSGSQISGFYLADYDRLSKILSTNNSPSRTCLIIGLSYALLDFAEEFTTSSSSLIIMETGGMKGRRKEMVREELHQVLANKFGAPVIHSEYGMTELLSQAYSQGYGKFRSQAWMKVLIRDSNDPFYFLPEEKTGCLNIIDLANFNSCSFIATEDLGKANMDGTFEMLGRFDPATARGCNLMIS